MKGGGGGFTASEAIHLSTKKKAETNPSERVQTLGVGKYNSKYRGFTTRRNLWVSLKKLEDLKRVHQKQKSCTALNN